MATRALRARTLRSFNLTPLIISSAALAFTSHASIALAAAMSDGGIIAAPDEDGDFDPLYPGTAVTRMRNIHARVATLTPRELSGPWPEVRRRLLWAGGLADNDDQRLIGKGFTGHAFNDFNHCDLTAMRGGVSHNKHDGKMIKGIGRGNLLGPGIVAASLPELGPGGSWSTCMQGANAQPEPRDVAHVQFRSRIAFKLVWCPPSFDAFVLVDDEGALLAQGRPVSGPLPALRQRATNFRVVQGSKYATAAIRVGLEEDAAGETPKEGHGRQKKR